MAKNQIYDDAESLHLPVPVGTESGDPVLVGKLPGTARTDRDEDGNANVKFGGAFRHSVVAKNAGGNSAVAIGDEIFIDAEGKELSKKATGTLFGFALGVVKSGETEEVIVKGSTP